LDLVVVALAVVLVVVMAAVEVQMVMLVKLRHRLVGVMEAHMAAAQGVVVRAVMYPQVTA
jgi:hypothetical protein